MGLATPSKTFNGAHLPLTKIGASSPRAEMVVELRPAENGQHPGATEGHVDNHTNGHLDSVDGAATVYGLSKRGAYNMLHRDVWGPRSKQLSDPWTPQNPGGTINLRLAENDMLHGEIEDYIHTQLRVQGVRHLTYSTGPQGSLRLRRAAARFLEKDFDSRSAVTYDDIFIMPGLTSAVDAMVWSVCDEGDGVIIPRPLYNGFKIDVQHRTDAVVVEAAFHDLEGYSSIDDVFDAAMNQKALSRALRKAQDDGIRVRAVLIANPHNPLGRCYPAETLMGIANFCGRNGLHFISDEIYARSTFRNANLPDAPPFISTLALDMSSVIPPRLRHVLYGASKDFCANGLRLGFLYTKNRGIMGSISSNSPFSWSPHVLQDVWASMLENDEWRRRFFDKNKTLMAERYRYATNFLRERGIGYYETYAGVFLWVDLLPYFSRNTDSTDSEVTVNGTLNASSKGSEAYLRCEAEIVDACASNGVMIAPGSSYRAEDHGWFRVTFTASEACLKEGLDRMWKSLCEVQNTR